MYHYFLLAFCFYVWWLFLRMASLVRFFSNKLIHSGLSIKGSMDGSHQIILDYVRRFWLKAKLWYVAAKRSNCCCYTLWLLNFVSFDFFQMFSHLTSYIVKVLNIWFLVQVSNPWPHHKILCRQSLSKK